ncbi:two-component system sensor histidine kinase YesM [Anaerotaenia torta]|uniref:sensor histidine kinase n=1 Tax=Anaerotaenia torta TaxID=433293 RepID=UPI003D25B684
MIKLHFNNLKIRSKLLLVYTFCVLIPIILTDAIIMYTVNSNYRESQMRDLGHAMERVEYNLKENIEDCILFTNNMYTDSSLDKFLNRNYSSYNAYYDEYSKLLNNNSLSYNYNYGMLSKIEIFADNDTMIGGGKISTFKSARDFEWYKEFKASGRDIFIYIYYDEMKKFIPGSGSCRTISIIRNLDYFGEKVEKILKIDINYNEMLVDVQNEKIDAAIYVRNRDYILFSNQPNTSGMKAFEVSGTLDGLQPAMSRSFKSSNEEWEVLIYAKSTPFWYVLVQNKGILYLILLDFLVPSLLIYLIGKSISHRLTIVSAYLSKVEQEQFEVIDCLEGEDEIGRVVRNYNLMVLRIKELIEVVFKRNAEKQALELSKKQAELQAIQSQVNPHFLFNTLETIRMRSLIKNETETAGIIGELAILFRKSMTWGEDRITVMEEMNFIEKYINIQRYRYGDKIKFNHYVMPECNSYLIPKLTISSFIENACIHGLEATEKEGVISLTVTRNGEFLYIEISDNGKGFEERRLEELRYMIAHADHKMLSESKSTGMLNAYLRLKMHFDSRVSFEIDSKPENGTDILIQISLNAVEDASGRNAGTAEADGKITGADGEEKEHAEGNDC